MAFNEVASVPTLFFDDRNTVCIHADELIKILSNTSGAEESVIQALSSHLSEFNLGRSFIESLLSTLPDLDFFEDQLEGLGVEKLSWPGDARDCPEFVIDRLKVSANPDQPTALFWFYYRECLWDYVASSQMLGAFYNQADWKLNDERCLLVFGALDKEEHYDEIYN